MKTRSIATRLFSSLTLILACLVVSGFAIISQAPTTTAASGNDFKAGRIIDDAIFYNSSAMSVSEIQSFLNSKVPTCDTKGSQLSEFGGPDLNGDGKVQRWEWGKSKHNQTIFTCLKDYKQNTPQMEAASGLCGGVSARTNRSAAGIIYDVARACSINPQVLIVLLNKEQSLVVDTWPLNQQYKSATGFDCPDTAPCDPKFAGFFYQVYHAARQFKVYKAFPNSYNYIAGRTNNIYWHPDLGRCGSSQVFIENQATAALYIYTPYRPNQAALNNMYGTGNSCSSYGNRNFWRMFTDWFGSTRSVGEAAIFKRYNQLGGASGKMGEAVSDIRCNLVRKGCYQSYENGSILWNKSSGAWESTGSIRSRWIETGWETGSLGYPNGPETRMATGGWYQSYEYGMIVGKPGTGYWESKGSIRKHWLSLGAQTGTLGYPTGAEKQQASGGWKQQYENGTIIGKASTSYWASSGEILEYYDEINGPAGALGYPNASVRCGLAKNGCYQSFERGAILSTPTTGTWESTGSIRNYWIKTGWETGALGYPTGPEVKLGNNGWKQTYEYGTIIGSKATGYWESKGSIAARWNTLGGHTGSLGYPTSPETKLSSGGWQQGYQYGVILGSATTGYWESKGSIRTHWLSLGAQTGTLGYPTGPEKALEDGGWEQDYQKGTIRSKNGKLTVIAN